MPPIVDLRSDTAFKDVAHSLLDSGFAVVENHSIPLLDLEAFYEAWDHFFTLGSPDDYPADAASQAGYFSPRLAETAWGAEKQDIKEYFQYWPQGPIPPELKSITEQFYESVFLLTRQIMAGLQQSTPESLWGRLDRPFSDCLSRSETMLRILRYPPLTGEEPAGAIRAGAHEDINLITLLPTASMPGLEIKPEGQEWQTVDAPNGSIIVNIGDMLQELTDGKLPSTTHQVVNPEGADATRARLTAPLFGHPYAAMKLSDRYTASSYLRERLQQINPEELQPVK